MLKITRYGGNPVLRPNPASSWEAEAVFNGCPIKKGEQTFLLYRALSAPHYHAGVQASLMMSDIGIASSADGIHFKNRRRFIVPEESWEAFGCEDPRVTKLGDTYYICYTALGANPPTAQSIKVGIALSKDLATVSEKHLVTPFNAKAMALFPEKINNKLAAVLTVHTDMPPSKIAVALFDTPSQIWSPERWEQWYASLDAHVIPLQRHAEDHVEVGAPPLKTKDGWLLFYSYIRNYASPRRLFSIEAVLLDIADPQKIRARIEMPLMVPEEFYEKYGLIPNVIFPSGALLEKKELRLYYGGADTVCCVASLSLPDLLRDMGLAGKQKSVQCARAKENPILAPNQRRSWEAKAVFNPAVFMEAGTTHIVYRAMSEANVSVFGYAAYDGVNIVERSEEPIYVPREPFEMGEAGRGYGCEDPRITKIGRVLYMCYTAYDGAHPPRVALTSIPVDKFLKRQWQYWEKPVLISPPGLDDKDACIFPKKIKGAYLLFHRLGDDIDIAFAKSLNFDGATWLEEHRWLKPRPGFWDSRKVGIAAPPLETKKGWILFYHGVSELDGVYRVGAVLLDAKDPTRIIGRTLYPVLEPRTAYEQEGQVRNVVFPCGATLKGNIITLYYGGADRVVGTATISVENIFSVLQ